MNSIHSKMTSQQTNIVDGTLIAKELRRELRQQIAEWTDIGNHQPKLVIVLIGSDPASHRYVQRKIEAADEVGIECTLMNPTDISEQELLNLIDKLNKDDSVDGIIVQLPLPKNIDKFKVANAISCDKDVDGFNEQNVGRLCIGLNTFVPCAALAVRELLTKLNIETKGKNAVIVGTSKNFGLPIATIMHNESNEEDAGGMAATVTMCNINTPPEKLTEFCKNADILITVTGVPGLIRADMIKPGACIVDVGMTPVRDHNGEVKFVGDVDFESAKSVAGCMTPVPGGIGPITITMLMKNTFKAAKILATKRR